MMIDYLTNRGTDKITNNLSDGNSEDYEMNYENICVLKYQSLIISLIIIMILFLWRMIMINDNS